MSSPNAMSGWLRDQWSNPRDNFTILLIIGGDIVQKAIAQVTAGPVPYFALVSFSLGWVCIVRTYSVPIKRWFTKTLRTQFQQCLQLLATFSLCPCQKLIAC
jgi:hypothetical protein